MEIAYLSGGIYARFDASSSVRLKDQLKDILRAVGQFEAIATFVPAPLYSSGRAVIAA
jgi:hypothetical protein